MSDAPIDNAPPLKRDPDRLASTAFDLVVVGGGIYGVWATLDAARRGLRVALLEQNDFGSGASANSQRVVHGGLRYLQHGDFKRMRESIRERSTLLRVASHLIEPMPFLVPTYGLGMRGRPAMFTAMKINDLVSADRNRGLPPTRRLPSGRLISREECLEIAPGIEPQGLTGGAVFYDAQVNNTERLALAVVRSAVAAGAQVANHVRVTGLFREGRRVTGVVAEDRITGRTFQVSSRMVLGCAGPWTGRNTSMFSGGLDSDYPKGFEVLRAIALVTPDLYDGMGLAVPSRMRFKDSKELISKGYRNLFVTSWRGMSLVGTFYTEHTGSPDELSVSADEVRAFLNEFNQAYPAAGLTYEDVRFTFVGLLPKAPTPTEGEPVCEKQYRLIDHSQSEGVDGLITVFGVKWTTARDVAEKAVTLAARKLGSNAVPCRTCADPIHGAPVGDPREVCARETSARPAWADEQLISDLFDTHGTACQTVLALAESEPPLRERLPGCKRTILAEVVHAVRNEMALTLPDVLFHRIGIGFLGYPGEACVSRCAEVMARELDWGPGQIADEIAAVQEAYRRRGLQIP